MRRRAALGGGGLLPSLGRRAWRLLAGSALFNLGAALVWPFLVVYLSDVRGIDLGTVGLILASISGVGMLGVPLVGWLVDRAGGGRVLALTLLTSAAGAVLFAIARGTATAFAAAFVTGVGMVGMWSTFSAVLAGAVTPGQRTAAFGASFLAGNLGTGLGAALGGVMLDVSRPASFGAAFLIDAGVYLAFAILLAAWGELGRPARPGPGADVGAGAAAVAPGPRGPVVGGYRAALADRALLATVGLACLLTGVIAALFMVVFPAWVTGPVGASTRLVGIGILANTMTIVACQLFVLRWFLVRWRRSRAVAVSTLFLGVAFLAMLAAGTARAGPLTVAGLIAAMMVVGVGETMMSPSIPALVNDLAPDRLRGRYNAVYTLATQAGQGLGPAAAGAILRQGLFAGLFVGLAATCGLAGLFALLLGRLVPASADWGRAVDGGRAANAALAAPRPDAAVPHGPRS